MAFKKILTVSTVSNRAKTIKVDIVKFNKTGTKRIFFTPEFEGKRLTSTMYARKGEAMGLAKAFIAFREKM